MSESTEQGPTTAQRIVRTAARAGLAIILAGVAVNLGLAWLSLRAGAMQTVTRVSPGWLALAAILGIAPTFVSAARVRLWSAFLGTSTGWAASTRAAFGTELGSSISPKAIGGAPVKIGLLVESGQSPGTAASITMLNNLEDMVFFAAVAPAMAFATARWEVPQVQAALGRIGERIAAAAPWLLGIVALGVVLLLLWRRRTRGAPRPKGGLRGLLSRMRHDFVAAYALVGRRGKSWFVVGVALSTLQWLLRCSVATAVLYGLGAAPDPVLFFLLQWVVFATMVFVPTPGAALGAEAAFAAVMSGFVPRPMLGLVGAAWRFLTFYLVLLVGLTVVPALGSRSRA